MEEKEMFQQLVYSNVEREGIANLMQWLDTTDFYSAPASTRFHGAFEGGLVQHSLAVYARLHELVSWYGLEASEETIAIVALFHDLCKISTYKVELRWRKDKNQQWEQYETYRKEEDYAYGGHGSKSVYLIMNFMKLLPEEAAAINAHMGAWDLSSYNNPGDVYDQNMLAWLLHVADEAASYIDKT